ncbi:hypothetical protein GOBAR_AA37240 [Gossypium barbadense]|uniref:SWIM-type domain-containing protein n=1 Tax=Gossypium barbadense TaxID=3634 RepID=A0A2P5VXB0_GOSBA|nr:hypothetical protein GOBAR_AA37240 [Gossypium barbadense]
MEARHVFVEYARDAMVANRQMTIGHRPNIPPRSYRVDFLNRQYDCRRFQTLHYSCAHAVAACGKVLLNVEQFVDDVYTLECTLHVWENELWVLPNLSTWEVPPTCLGECVHPRACPDKGLCRNLNGHPQSSKIHNEMVIREKFDSKRCGLCRLAGYNWSKCPQ